MRNVLQNQNYELKEAKKLYKATELGTNLCGLKTSFTLCDRIKC